MMDTSKIRQFNRFYTRMLGVFSKNVFGLQYSMLEMRILGEIGRQAGITAVQLVQLLNIDKSYLSRILRKLSKDNLVSRDKDQSDARVQHLKLTSKGQQLNDYVEQQSDRQVARRLSGMDKKDILDLEEAMSTIERLFKKHAVEKNGQED